MNKLTQIQPEPQTAPQDQPVSQQDIDLQTIVEQLGRAFRITPIGSRRFRCNKYARPSAYPLPAVWPRLSYCGSATPASRN